MGFLGTLSYVLIYTSVARIATLTMQEKVGGVSGQGPEEGIPCPSTSLLEFFGIRDCSSFFSSSFFSCLKLPNTNPEEEEVNSHSFF